MSKKLTLGLFALLFVVTGVQSLAISKIQNNSSEKTQSVVANLDSYKSNNNQQASVVSSSKISSVLLERYLKNKYPKDYGDRIDRINSKVESLVVNSGIGDNEDLAQKNIFHRILCGIMGGNYYQEYMGGGVYCARINASLLSAGGGSGDSDVFSSERSEIKTSTNAEYLKNISQNNIEQIPAISEGVQNILEEEGVDINALGGPGFRRFLCKVFGGTWGDSVGEIEGVTVWVQSCTW